MYNEGTRGQATQAIQPNTSNLTLILALMYD